MHLYTQCPGHCREVVGRRVVGTEDARVCYQSFEVFETRSNSSRVFAWYLQIVQIKRLRNHCYTGLARWGPYRVVRSSHLSPRRGWTHLDSERERVCVSDWLAATSMRDGSFIHADADFNLDTPTPLLSTQAMQIGEIFTLVGLPWKPPKQDGRAAEPKSNAAE